MLSKAGTIPPVLLLEVSVDLDFANFLNFLYLLPLALSNWLIMSLASSSEPTRISAVCTLGSYFFHCLLMALLEKVE